MSLPSNWNPLVSTSSRLAFPENLHEKAVEICRKARDEAGNSKLIQDAPFERMVDLWMVCLIIGRAYKKFDPEVSTKDFIGGEIFQGDISKISIILAICFAHENMDSEILGNSKKCLKIANSYVAGGLPMVLEAIESGVSTNIENMYKCLINDDFLY